MSQDTTIVVKDGNEFKVTDAGKNLKVTKFHIAKYNYAIRCMGGVTKPDNMPWKPLFFPLATSRYLEQFKTTTYSTIWSKLFIFFGISSCLLFLVLCVLEGILILTLPYEVVPLLVTCQYISLTFLIFYGACIMIICYNHYYKEYTICSCIPVEENAFSGSNNFIEVELLKYKTLVKVDDNITSLLNISDNTKITIMMYKKYWWDENYVEPISKTVRAFFAALICFGACCYFITANNANGIKSEDILS
jgi:hypothetical protein